METRKRRAAAARRLVRSKTGQLPRNPFEGLPRFLIRLADPRQLRMALQEERGRSRHD